MSALIIPANMQILQLWILGGREIGSDELGESLIVVRTENGRRYLQQAMQDGYINAKRAEMNILPLSQPNLLKARARVYGQMLAMKMSRAPFPAFLDFDLKRAWLEFFTVKEKVQFILGTMKRVNRRKLKKRLPVRNNETQH